MVVDHKHLIIRACAVNPPKDEASLNSWLMALTASIKMKICIPPRSVYVDAPGNRGLTGQIGIETSHIAIHIWDEETPSTIQMDVYSCKDFEVGTVLEGLRPWGLGAYELMLIDRNHVFTIADHVLQRADGSPVPQAGRSV